jgi:hypothetical protein
VGCLLTVLNHVGQSNLRIAVVSRARVFNNQLNRPNSFLSMNGLTV